MKAKAEGADVAMLPPPFFFTYSGEDLEEFCRQAAPQIGLPTLIYNLPVFVSPVPTDAAVRLVTEVEEHNLRQGQQRQLRDARRAYRLEPSDWPATMEFSRRHCTAVFARAVSPVSYPNLN